VGKPGFYVAVYNKEGNQKAGVLEDTMMSEKEARERAGRLREAKRASAAGAARTPPIGAKASGTMRGTRCETPIQVGR
jgi:inosine/xanthosine triphosphate pyrophosphatase family protein